MPLFVPEECLTVTGRVVGEQIQIIEDDTLFAPAAAVREAKEQA